MRKTDLPFLHFMVRSGFGRSSTLLSPSESKDTSSVGSFFVPVSGDRELFPSYRFHFSIYRGDGMFLEDDKHQKVILTGVATTAQAKRADRLILMVSVPDSEIMGSWWVPNVYPPLPRLFEQKGELVIPILQRTPRGRSVKYCGAFLHPDFAFPFIELHPTEPQTLDTLLEKFGISLIGCDPHTEYRRGRHVSGRRKLFSAKDT